MTVKVFNVGDVLAAADVNSWLAPLAAVKSANQTISSQTALVNDADLRISLASTAQYEFHAFIRYDSTTGADFKMSMSVPAGADCRYGVTRQNLSNAFGGNVDNGAADNVQCLGAGVGNIVVATLFGMAFTSGTAGNLIFQWAQNTSTAGNTTLHQFSYLSARRIG